MKLSFILALSAAFLISCKKEQPAAATPPIEKAEWLIGTWENNSRAGLLSESWTKLPNGNFSGKGFFAAGNDTVFSEKLELKQEDGDLYYVATVKGQNNGEAVEFPLLSATSEQLIFENNAHDFPQRIVYTHYGDSLIAIVSGLKDGQLETENFRMRKASR